MNVVFRVDASSLMGTGHLVRCLTLARVLRARGVEVRFITRAHPGHLLHLLSNECMPVTVLPYPASEPVADNDVYAKWRGVPVSNDAKETIIALGGQRPDWLVVDHYGLDATWEKLVHPHIGRLLAIDDLPDRAHDCDLFLNQNYGATHGTLPISCTTLLGPRYALLSPEYADCRKTLVRPSDSVRRLFVFFGGVDAENLTGETLQVLSQPEFAALEIDVVCGANFPHRAVLEAQVAARTGTRLHAGKPHLADLLAQADLAIGAGGGTTWERLCLGVPAIIVGVAENQLTACQSLAREGIVDYLGPLSTWKPEALRNRLRALLAAPNTLRRFAMEGMRLVDGRGALRVAETLAPTSPKAWDVSPIKSAHDVFKSEWAAGLTSAPIATEARYFVLEAKGLPLGVARFETREAETFLALATDFFGPPILAKKHLFASALRLLRDAIPKGLGAAAGAHLKPLRQIGPPVAQNLHLAILSDRSSWLNDFLAELVLEWIADGHSVEWVNASAELSGGDLCFYLSCSQIVPARIRQMFKQNLVVHESALPQGKGWSPLTWQVLEGRSEIPVTLFEATDHVDSGVIYDQQLLGLKGSELIDELRQLQARATLDLCRRFVRSYPDCVKNGRPQEGKESFYARRQASDSRLLIDRSLSEQFNLLRVVDNDRYPAFFEYCGRKYQLVITAQ